MTDRPRPAAAAAPRAASPRWHRRKNARPEEILEAALEVFAARGYAATRLEEVARRAGVSKGTIYLYFPGKEALFKAAVRRGLVPNIARAEALARGHAESASDALRALAHAVWDLVGESHLSGIPKLIIAEAANFPELARFYWAEVAGRALGLIGSLIEQGMARGEFRRVDPRFATLALMGPVFFAVLFKHSLHPVSGLNLDFRAFLDFHLDNFLRGLAA
ncbi:MAG TPA: TetR/AcrR family transcriptional regulator [Gemmatimonadales bacterium]|nr:TetR/AcrR family transcriptional regulator [Gemmatimonadales bacterium]